MEKWNDYNARINDLGICLLETIIPRCDTVVLLYKGDFREIYLDNEICSQILSPLDTAVDIKISNTLLSCKYHKDYLKSDINLAERLIAGKCGITAEKDLLDCILDISEKTRGVFVYKFEKI